MIRTRQTVDDDDEFKTLFGSGPHILAITDEELELVAALLALVKLGYDPYKQAASKLLHTIGDIAADQDYCVLALDMVRPEFHVYDDDYTVTAIYDTDTTIEIIV